MLQMFCKVEVVVGEGQFGEADIWKTFGFSSSVKLFPIHVQLRADGYPPFFIQTLNAVTIWDRFLA